MFILHLMALLRSTAIFFVLKLYRFHVKPTLKSGTFLTAFGLICAQLTESSDTFLILSAFWSIPSLSIKS